jgi:hypothetical protein
LASTPVKYSSYSRPKSTVSCEGNDVRLVVTRLKFTVIDCPGVIEALLATIIGTE